MAELPLDQGIPRFKQNEDRFDRFTNGTNTQSITHSDGQTSPTIRKFLKDKNDQIDQLFNPKFSDIEDLLSEIQKRFDTFDEILAKADSALQPSENLADLSDINIALENLNLSTLVGVLPNPSLNVQGTGMAGFDGVNLFLYQAPSSFSESPTLRVDRNIQYAGGVSGNTYSALWVYATAGKESSGFEWAAKFEMNNSSKKSLNAENQAFSATSRKIATSLEEVGPTWGGTINAIGENGRHDPTALLCGLEVNSGVAFDGGTDSLRTRRGIMLSLGSSSGTHIGDGILMSSTPGSVIDHALSFRSFGGSAGNFGVLIDATDANVTSKVVMMMREAQRIVFDGEVNGAFYRHLNYETGKLRYNVSGTDVFTISDSGILEATQLSLISSTSYATALAGGGGGLPVAPDGYVLIKLDGASKVIPYYNPPT